MEIRADSLCECVAPVSCAPVASATLRRRPSHRVWHIATLLAKLAPLCVVTFLFLTSSLPAQQSSAQDAPAWPVTNPMPGHGHMIPNPTTGMQAPQDRPTDESCLLWMVEGTQQTTVSAATLQVPGKARSQYSKACDDLRSHKPDNAEDHLRKAIQLYPRYTAAWALLGQVLSAGHRISEAQTACSQATAIDSGFTQAYLCLADVAAQQKDWSRSLEMADRALAMGPAQDVYAYFYSANAQLHLSQISEAEHNAQQIIQVDRFHRIPQAHLLLAQVYAAKHDFDKAVAQLRVYLKIAPNAPDSAGARKSLAEIESQFSK